MEEGIEFLRLSKEIEIMQKHFFIQFKENTKNQYMLLSNEPHSIVVPAPAVSSFLDRFDCFVASQPNVCINKGLKIDDRFYCFVSGRNRWGRFLKVSESSASNRGSFIIIPSGNDRNDGWELFRKTVAEIDHTAKVFFPPLEGQMPVPPQNNGELKDASDDLNGGFDSESDSFDISKKLKTEQKTFFFDLMGSNRGHFLQISEVTSVNRSFIRIPESALGQFHEILGHFVEKTTLEGLSTAMNLEQCSSCCSSEPHESTEEESSNTSLQDKAQDDS